MVLGADAARATRSGRERFVLALLVAAYASIYLWDENANIKIG